jgi:hypothetical protein
MVNWNSIKESVDRFVLWTKDSVVLNAAAKVALQNIPVVGNTLAEIYDEAGESGDEKSTIILLQEILARITVLGETGFQKSSELIEESRRLGQGALASLTTANEKLRGLDEEVRKIREDMGPMMGALERLESEVLGLAWGASDFAPSSNADQATLLVLLEASLNRSGEIFGEQLRISGRILQDSELDVPNEFQGLDDRLWWLSKNGGIPPAMQTAHRELRRVTDRMRDVNVRVRWLIRKNKSMLPETIPVQELEEHLSTWLAKYEYLREHDDEHMALVFVGVPPTNVPFPPKADSAVSDALRKSIKAARLGHILD